MSEGYDGLPAYYVQSSDPLTPNYGFSLKGMDPIIAENFVIADAAIAGGGVSSLTGDGTIFNNSASTGAVTLSLATQSAHALLIGPSSGSAAKPTFRGLLTSDLPASGTWAFTGIIAGNNNSISFSSTQLGLLLAGYNFAQMANNNFAVMSVGDTLGHGNFNIQGAGSAQIQSDTAGNIITFKGTSLVMNNNTTFSAEIIDGSASPGTNGQILSSTATGVKWIAAPSSGVSSVTGDGTIFNNSASTGAVTLSLATQSAHAVLIGPTSGSAANPTFRALATGDLPTTGTWAFAGVISGNLQFSAEILDSTGVAGSNGQVLTSTGSAVVWQSNSGGTPAWSSLTNATGNLSLSNAGNSTTFNQTSAVAWLWANTTAATSSTTSSSPLMELSGTYWNGSASAADTWSWQDVLGTGTNGTSTLTLTHSGTTGALSVSMPGAVTLKLGTASTSTGAITLFNSSGTSTGTMTGQANGIALTNASGAFSLSAVSGFNLAGSGSTQISLSAPMTFSLGPTSNAAMYNFNTATAATSGQSQSTGLVLNGRYWNGSASATDAWTIEDVVANGTNGTSTLTISHTGSTGTASCSIPGISAYTYLGNTWSLLSVGVPLILATVNSTGLTANVSSTTLFTPASTQAGMYRAIVYWVCTTAASSTGTVPSFNVVYTDDSGTAQTVTSAPISSSNTVGSYGRLQLDFYSAALDAISYSTTGYASSGATSLTYSIRIRLEYLG